MAGGSTASGRFGAAAIAAALHAAALLAVASCAGCGSVGAPSRQQEPASSTGPSAALTEADSGRTVRLPAGEEADLRLSGGHVWTEPRVAGSAVRLVPVQYVRDPGFREWRIVTAGTGTATITSSGKAQCTPGDVCSNAILAFSVTIVVA